MIGCPLDVTAEALVYLRKRYEGRGECGQNRRCLGDPNLR